MPDQELPEGININREYWKDDQRGVNVEYQKDGITILGQFVVAYYDQKSGQFKIIASANRLDTGNHIEVGCVVRDVNEAASWLIHIPNTMLGGLFTEGGDTTNPMQAVRQLCGAMIGELERLFENATKTNNQYLELQEAIRKELERPLPNLDPREETSVFLDRMRRKYNIGPNRKWFD